MAIIIKSVGPKTGAGTASISGTTLTVTAISSGSLDVGQNISIAGTTNAAKVVEMLTGTGGTGTYRLDVPLTVSSASFTAARDFAAISEWRASLPASTVAVGNAYIADVYQDGDYAVSSTWLSIAADSIITSPECFLMVRAAKGHSFTDHPTYKSNRLAYDASKGVTVRMTVSGVPVRTEVDNLIIQGIQFNVINSTSDYINIKGAGSRFENCILTANVVATGHSVVRLMEGAALENCLVVVRNTFAVNAAVAVYRGGRVNNCTIVRPSNYAASGRAIAGDLTGNVRVTNCMAFGFTTLAAAFNGATLAGSNNVTGAATSPFVGDTVSAVYDDQFYVTANTGGLEDFRLKAGSAGIDRGTVVAGSEYDMFGTYRQNPDAGCFEIEEAADALILIGPDSGLNGQASEAFTVMKNGSSTSSVTVTPAGAGLTFSPTSITIAADKQSATFTATPTSPGNKSITLTNDGGLTNPAAKTYTSISVATSITLTPPAYLRAGAKSAPFSVGVNGGMDANVTLTPSDGGRGGLFEPATLTLGPGNESGLFTYTPAAVGPVTISLTNNGGLANPGTYSTSARAPKVANPTPSSPGVRVVHVGTGKDFADGNAFRTYLATQALATNAEILIAEFWENTVLSGNYGPADYSSNYYCIMRPVPGYAEKDLNPGVLSLVEEGVKLSLASNSKVQLGTSLEDFGISMSGSFKLSLGGPNTGSALQRIRGCRFETSGTGNIEFGEFNNVAVFDNNLVVRLAGTARLNGSGSTKIRSNTFVALNGAEGQFVYSNTSAELSNNAFVNAGPSPVGGTFSTVQGNYTNNAVTTARVGLTVETNTPFLVSTSNFLPAAGSPLLGNATAIANSTIDARGNNRGTDPDVGAAQRIAAVALPTGTVTSQPAPNGQRLVIEFTTTGNPTGGSAVLESTTGGSTSVAGLIALVTNAGAATFENIPADTWLPKIVLSNDGGPSDVVGTRSFTIRGMGGGGVTESGENQNPDVPTVTFIAITPDVATSANGETVQLSATVFGQNNPPVEVTWTTSIGTIDETGMFTPPPTTDATQTAQIRATSVFDPTRYGTATVTVAAAVQSPTVTAVVLTPETASTTNTPVQFTAVAEGTNSPPQTFTWTASIGTISSNGLYTPPAQTNQEQVATIRATSTLNTSRFDEATVTIAAGNVPAPVVETVTVSPATAITTGNTIQFIASVAGQNNPPQTVTWEVTLGTINSSGLYTPPPINDQVRIATITATSTLDTSKKGTAMATIAADSPSQPSNLVPSKVRTLKVLAETGRFTGGAFWGLSNPTRPVGRKDKDSCIDITLDWKDVLDDISDTLKEVEFLLDGVEQAGYRVTGTETTIVVSGGVGPTSSVTFRIFTNSTPPRSEDRTVYLEIGEQ